MKKNIFIFFILFISYCGVYSNSVDFYGDKEVSWGLGNLEVKEIRKEIESLQGKTGLNTDIVILGKNDSKGCYLNPNFDNCVKENYGYSSDIIITLKMKSDISDRGDIRSYMDNKNYPIITTDKLKSIQDYIVYNFGNNDFKKGILEYYQRLDSDISTTCSWLKEENKKFGGDNDELDCKISNLLELYKINDNLREEYNKQVSFKRNIYIALSFGIIILFTILMQIYYISRLRKLYNDIKFQILDIEDKKTFIVDSDVAKDKLGLILKKIETYFGNSDKIWIKTRKYYIEIDKEANEIIDEFDKSVMNFDLQQQLKDEVEKAKDVNI